MYEKDEGCAAAFPPLLHLLLKVFQPHHIALIRTINPATMPTTTPAIVATGVPVPAPGFGDCVGEMMPPPPPPPTTARVVDVEAAAGVVAVDAVTVVDVILVAAAVVDTVVFVAGALLMLK